MFNNDLIYGDVDLLSTSGHLYTFNDPCNIWAADRGVPSEVAKAKLNNTLSLTLQDRLARNRKPPGDRRDTNLIVNYLPDGFYEKELFDLFSQAGTIVHHHVVRNKDNRSECYGFVDFDKSADAEKAIEMFHQYQIQNKKLKVQNAAEGLQIKEEERLRALKCITNIGYNVEVKNAPIRWTINDVKNVFGKYGDLVKVYENIIEDVENTAELKTKTFNIIFRYHTIASKVVKKKNKTPAEALWPLELELSIVGQEIIETPSESVRSRQRSKTKFDQMSDSSWENKQDTKIDNVYYRNFENTINYWTDSTDISQLGFPLTSNGRPILKHKDNFMHLNNGIYELNTDKNDKWNNTLTNDTTQSFFENIHGSCNDIKAIWAVKEFINTDLLAPQDIYIKTPLVPCRFRGGEDKNKFKANIWYKMENMQPTGSFKLRGMSNWCYRAKVDGVETVISSSEGNAGLAAAYVCRLYKLKCIVVVPLTTPLGIVAELIKEKAEVIQEGSSWKEAHVKAETLSLITTRSKLVHPFDDPLLWHGYESIVDEIVAEMRNTRIDMIVLSVGGGGLLNGIAQGISKNNLSKVTAILGLETEGCATFNKSITANQMVSINSNSLAASLSAPIISQRTWDIYCSQEFHLFSKTCSDIDAIESCYQFLNEQNCLVEPACGTSLSVVYNGTLDKMAEYRTSDLNVVVIVCGGRCVDITSLLETRQSYSMYNEPMSIRDQFNSLDLNKEPQCFLPSERNATAYNRYNTPLSNYSNVYSSAPPRNYAAALSEGGKFPFGSRNISGNQSNSNYNFSTDNTNFNDVPSPVGSQHSDKENHMLHR